MGNLKVKPVSWNNLPFPRQALILCVCNTNVWTLRNFLRLTWNLKLWSANSPTLSQTSPGFYMSAVEVVWKHCGKVEIALYEQFLLFPQCFLPFWRTSCNFHQTWYCRLRSPSVWMNLEFVVWERVNVLTLYQTTKFQTNKNQWHLQGKK